MQTPFSPLSFGKRFMKIRSAVPENGYLVFLWRTEKQKNICKTYTHPPHRRLRKTTLAAVWTVEEMCLKMSLEGVQRSRRTDNQWQIVPNARSPTVHVVYAARSICVCGWRSQTLSGVVVSRPVQISCQIRQRCVVAAAEDEYGQSEFNTLRGAQLNYIYTSLTSYECTVGSGTARRQIKVSCAIAA